MTRHIEIERRWLVKLPLSEEARTIIETDPDAPTRIVQTYLKSNDDTVRRVRFVETDMWGTKFSHFVHTEKRLIERGVNEEDEHSLTEAEYQVALLERDVEHHTIEKTRYHLHYKGHLWELDIFEGTLTGLAILELELGSKDEAFELPPFLAIEHEITFEGGWSNFELSKSWVDMEGSVFQPKTSWFGSLIEKASNLWSEIVQ